MGDPPVSHDPRDNRAFFERVRDDGAAAKKKTMRMIAKLASLGTPHQRSPLNEMIHHVKRAWTIGSDRKSMRRQQDIDSWSDQAEVAYYEDCRAARCS